MGWILGSIAMGFLLDCLLGDPQGAIHPVRGIGFLISRGEAALRPRFPMTPNGERQAGALLSLSVILLSALLPLVALLVCQRINPILAFIVQSVFCYQIFAARSLRDESMKVYRALKGGDLAASRKAVSMIVGRDTDRLDQSGIAKAAVETVAENTSDGVVAPLVFMMLGGAPLGFFYKAVNTLDSMIGYKNARYLNFGRFAARLDDAVNFIPARLSAVLMLCAAFLLRMDVKRGWHIFRRDRFQHASPNSAQTESVCAGALGIQLAGDAWYFNELHHKPTIGDAVRPVEFEDIRRANRLMYGTTLLTLLLLGIVRLLIIRIL